MSEPTGPNAGSPWSPQRLFDYLESLGIATTTVDHEPVFTVAEARHLRRLPGGHCKSLFLRNKKGRMWLVTVEQDRPVDLATLADTLGAGRLGFASPRRLMSYLGVEPGAVSPFGVVNDPGGEVMVALDRALTEHERINVHPLDNSRTTSIATADLVRFLEATGHPPRLLAPSEM
jgi:Ala-tRNA(Pro) deacylase